MTATTISSESLDRRAVRAARSQTKLRAALGFARQMLHALATAGSRPTHELQSLTGPSGAPLWTRSALPGERYCNPSS